MTDLAARLADEQSVTATPERAAQLATIARRLNDATREAADRQTALDDPATYLHRLAALRPDDAS